MNERDRPIRVLLTKPGLDGHSRGVKVVAYALRNAGIEVVYTGLRQTPEEIIATAIQEGVDIIGLSILSGAHLTICGQLMKHIKKEGLEDITVIVGGAIPLKDELRLKELGIARVFPTNSKLEDIVNYIIDVRR